MMTPKERAVMQQALDALEHLQTWPMAKEAITALREALEVTEASISDHKLAEQAEQEPVAWLWKPSKPFPQYTVITDKKEYLKAAKEQGVEITPLYAAPVRTVDLTDDEIWDALTSIGFGTSCYEDARAVIAADREKNK